MARSVPCASCGIQHENRGPFCGDYCKAVAEFIRLCRRWIREPAKQADPEYPYVLQVRLAFLNADFLGRGTVYDENARHLSSAQKAAIWERDQGRCVRCGKPGAEVDHISSSSDDPANLQLLCLDCHHAKTRQAMAPVTDAADREALDRFYTALGRRINATQPMNACDNEQSWSKLWRRWPDLEPGGTGYSSSAVPLGFNDILALIANFMPDRASESDSAS